MNNYIDIIIPSAIILTTGLTLITSPTVLYDKFEQRYNITLSYNLEKSILRGMLYGLSLASLTLILKR